MKAKSFTSALLPGILAIAFSSCSSTEIFDLETEASDILAIGVSAPDAYSFPATRVSDNVQLRYVGKLFLKRGTDDYKYVQRAECLAKDGNQLIFHVDKGTYKIRVFADYVDASISEPIETSSLYDSDIKYDSYGDKYYFTEDRYQPDIIKMKAIRDPDNTSIKYEDYSNINNDDYDCFAITSEEIVKEDPKATVNLTLRRAVSKIRFIATKTENVNVTKIKITRFTYYNKCRLDDIKSSTQDQFTSSSALSLNLFSFPPTNIKSGELFYFYTFAAGNGKDEGMRDISFDLYKNDETEPFNSVTLPGATLYPEANYIYNVKGDFFQSDMLNNIIEVNLEDAEAWKQKDQNF